MKNGVKIWLIVAAALVLLGGVLFVGVMSMLKWDFHKLSTVSYETNIYEINETYQNISIVADTADIVFVASENPNGLITCYEQQAMKHLVTVKDDTLVIEVADSRKWYHYIGISFSSSKITVCIPSATYGALSVKTDTGNVELSGDFQFKSIDISAHTGDVSNHASAEETVRVKTSTGNISIANISAGALDLSVSTGKVNVSSVLCKGDASVKVSTGKINASHVSCKSFATTGSTGDVFLDDLIAEEGITIKRSTGDVKLDACDASELLVETDTGDVKGSLCSEKVFITKTNTGKIDVPKTTTGGRCEIKTNTGDIKLQIVGG